MNSIREYLEPFNRQYNRYLNGYIMSDMLQFKGQKGSGNSYISKVFRAQKYEIMSEYENVAKNVVSPSYLSFLKDNFVRLVVLNGVQRLVTAYQAIPGIIRSGRPSSMGFLFTQIMNDGAFRGTLRGLSANIAHTSLVLWSSTLLTNQTQSGYFGFLASYLTLDALLTPLDGLKNNMYAKTIDPIGLKSALNISNPFKYAGMLSKTLFNIPFATAIYSTTQEDENSWAYWLATALSYPLLTKRTILQTAQVSNLQGLTLGSYRGVIPFMLMNYFFCWKLSALYSKEKQEKLYEQSVQRANEKVSAGF